MFFCNVVFCKLLSMFGDDLSRFIPFEKEYEDLQFPI